MTQNNEVQLIVQRLSNQISQLVLENAALSAKLEMLAHHHEHEHEHEIDGGEVEEKPTKKSS